MKNRRALAVFWAGTALIAAAVIYVACLVRREPGIAAVIGGSILFAGGLIFAGYRLILHFAPAHFAKIFLNRSIRRNAPVWFACYDGDAEDSGPSVLFSAFLDGYDGLELLRFSCGPEKGPVLRKLEKGAELTAAFLNGTQNLNLTGTLHLLQTGLEDGRWKFALHVKTGRLSNRPQVFVVSGKR